MGTKLRKWEETCLLYQLSLYDRYWIYHLCMRRLACIRNYTLRLLGTAATNIPFLGVLYTVWSQKIYITSHHNWVGEARLKGPGNYRGQWGWTVDLVSRCPLIQYRLVIQKFNKCKEVAVVILQTKKSC